MAQGFGLRAVCLGLSASRQQLSTLSTSTVQLADSGSEGCTRQSQAHDRQASTSQHEGLAGPPSTANCGAATGSRTVHLADAEPAPAR
jgi:hypothetical protein